MNPMSGKAPRLLTIGCGLMVLVVVGLMAWLGPVLLAFEREGFLDPAQRREWEGDSRANLKALAVAVQKFNTSEDRLPDADQWMDQIAVYLRTYDITAEDAKLKLVNPLVQPAGEGVYGYSFNEALSGKFLDEVPNSDRTVLIFDGKDTGRNAHGDPATDQATPPRPGGNLAVTVSGEVKPLAELLASN